MRASPETTQAIALGVGSFLAVVATGVVIMAVDRWRKR